MIHAILLGVLGGLSLALTGIAAAGPSLVANRMAVTMTRSLEGTPLAFDSVSWTPRAATHASWGEVGDLSGALQIQGAPLPVAPIAWRLAGIRVEPLSLFGTPVLSVPARLGLDIQVRDAELAPAVRGLLPTLLRDQLPLPAGINPEIGLRSLQFAQGRIEAVLSVRVPLMGGMALPIQASLRPVLLPDGVLAIEDVSVRMMGQELGRRLPVPARIDFAAYLPPEITDAGVAELTVAEGVFTLRIRANVRQIPARSRAVEPAL
ncbi:MAG: hypothetical protein VKO64_10370 [Candidatus Sericytochromatia bacterium]|nr:hypothetical protein [Candidatus Sericytochromatia bacterium]